MILIGTFPNGRQVWVTEAEYESIIGDLFLRIDRAPQLGTPENGVV